MSGRHALALLLYRPPPASALLQLLVPRASVYSSRRHDSAAAVAFPLATCTQQRALQSQPSREASPAASAPGEAAELLPFRDFAEVFKHATTGELLRAYIVFRMCGIKALVHNGGVLMSLSNRILGTWATSFLVKHTFFKQFCAGETQEEVQATIQRLQKRGVSSILDYAAESDVKSDTPDNKPIIVSKALDRTAVPVARVYSYESELQCDKHVDMFINAIDTAGSLPGQGFAAVKVTALGNPELLERMSNAISVARGLFERFDSDKSGYIDKEDFVAAHELVFPDASAEDRARTFMHFDQQGQGKVDYVAWCQGLSLRQMPGIAESIHRAYSGQEDLKHSWLGDLSASCLTDEEYTLVKAMRKRLEKIVDRAEAKNVKLMIDAEHTYFQPAIDYLALRLMKQYNVKGCAIIYNTYQAYLRTSLKHLTDDMERAKREGYVFAAKLVRGAYLSLERARAADKGTPSPVWDTIEETHASYKACLELILSKVPNGNVEVLLGTHNEDSIRQAVDAMHKQGLQPGQCPVYFGQLLGMADHLTFTLGSHGYPAFKYTPYGKVLEVVPYLLRRAQENASMLDGAKADLQLLKAELSRRLIRRPKSA